MAMRRIAAGLAVVLVSTGGVPATAQEPAKYQLSFTVIGPDGRLARNAELLLSPLTESGEDPGTITVTNGHARVRVPQGGYLLDSSVPAANGDSYRILQPGLQVNGQKVIVVDARQAKPVSTTVPRKSARVMDAIHVDYIARLGDAGVADTAHAEPGHRLFTAQVGPIPTGMSLVSHISSHWAVPGPKGDFADTPFSYDLSQRISGFPAGYQRVVRESGLTKVVSQHTRTSDRPLVKLMSASAGEIPGAVAEFPFRHSGTVTHYLDPVRWDVELAELGGSRSTDVFGYDELPAAGRRWNAAPFYPTWRFLGRAERQHNQMMFDLMSHSDQDGHPGYSPLDTDAMRLYADGRLVKSSADLRLTATGLPSKSTSYRLEAEYSRPSWSQLSVRGSAVWTFPSQSVVAVTDLPLQTVRFRPSIDAANLVRRTPLTVLPFQADSRDGVPAPKAAKLQYSGDDGKTWRQAAVIRRKNGTFVAVFGTPKGAYVSLRAQLTGTTGAAVDQTLIRAYQLK
ncbi:hypothetical protein GCM10022235_08310 [Kribbella ginsengisoli]|uniref:Uncharacterized protein n=2 Tax=Kribbella ginsengisoli TaxID=363865 RepID=A0ABP6W0H7_9ACTN